MNWAIKFFLLMALLSYLPAPVSAATVHGRDSMEKNHAWFLGSPDHKTATWCVQMEGSLFDLSHMALWITEAMGIWRNFYSGYARVHEYNAVPANGRELDPAPFLAPFESPRVCRGNEDLTIYFGVEDERVRAAKTAYSNPLGFAHLESYDEKTGWGRGLVWISRHRSKTNFTFALILHEIGHVFGCGHIAGTIMDEAIADKITDAEKDYDNKFLDELVTPSGYGYQANAWINISRSINTPDWNSRIYKELDIRYGSEQQEAFEWLLDTRWEGKLFIEFPTFFSSKDYGKHFDATRMINAYYGTCFHLDRRGTKGMFSACEFSKQIQVESETYVPISDRALFRKIRDGKEWSIPLYGRILTGKIQSKSGEVAPIIITSNLEAEFAVYLLLENKKLRIF